MRLTDYIKQVGDADFARRFRIAERTAMSYRLKERTPRGPLAQRIVNETPVTWEGIYGQEVAARRSN